MGDIQIKKSGDVHEVIVIGSGAGGGMTAYILTGALQPSVFLPVKWVLKT